MSEFSTIVNDLEAFPHVLSAMLADVDEAALTYRPGPDLWSIVEIVGHLDDVDALMRGRIELALAEDNPTVPVYEEKAPVKHREFQGQPFEHVLEKFLRGRASFVEMLRNLSETELERTVQHPMHGIMSAARIPASLPKHDSTHRDQIAANLSHYAATVAATDVGA